MTHRMTTGASMSVCPKHSLNARAKVSQSAMPMPQHPCIHTRATPAVLDMRTNISKSLRLPQHRVSATCRILQSSHHLCAYMLWAVVVSVLCAQNRKLPPQEAHTAATTHHCHLSHPSVESPGHMQIAQAATVTHPSVDSPWYSAPTPKFRPSQSSDEERLSQCTVDRQSEPSPDEQSEGKSASEAVFFAFISGWKCVHRKKNATVRAVLEDDLCHYGEW